MRAHAVGECNLQYCKVHILEYSAKEESIAESIVTWAGHASKGTRRERNRKGDTGHRQIPTDRHQEQHLQSARVKATTSVTKEGSHGGLAEAETERRHAHHTHRHKERKEHAPRTQREPDTNHDMGSWYRDASTAEPRPRGPAQSRAATWELCAGTYQPLTVWKNPTSSQL